MTPFTLTINDTARALGIGRTKIYELIMSGELETVKIGSRRLVKVASIERLLNGPEEESDGELQAIKNCYYSSTRKA